MRGCSTEAGTQAEAHRVWGARRSLHRLRQCPQDESVVASPLVAEQQGTCPAAVVSADKLTNATRGRGLTAHAAPPQLRLRAAGRSVHRGILYGTTHTHFSLPVAPVIHISLRHLCRSHAVRGHAYPRVRCECPRRMNPSRQVVPSSTQRCLLSALIISGGVPVVASEFVVPVLSTRRHARHRAAAGPVLLAATPPQLLHNIYQEKSSLSFKIYYSITINTTTKQLQFRCKTRRHAADRLF